MAWWTPSPSWPRWRRRAACCATWTRAWAASSCPFAKKLGRDIPPFDFAVPGVTSMSADLHKYGYAAKGASVVLYRNRELRRHQFFTYAGWPGGLYVSPSMTGTRPGGAIAAAWAVLHYLGEEGYLDHARRILATDGQAPLGHQRHPRPARARRAARWASSRSPRTRSTCTSWATPWRRVAGSWTGSRTLPRCTDDHPRRTRASRTPCSRICASAPRSSRPASPRPRAARRCTAWLASIPDRQQVDGFLLDFLDGRVRSRLSGANSGYDSGEWSVR